MPAASLHAQCAAEQQRRRWPMTNGQRRRVSSPRWLLRPRTNTRARPPFPFASSRGRGDQVLHHSFAVIGALLGPRVARAAKQSVLQLVLRERLSGASAGRVRRRAASGQSFQEEEMGEDEERRERGPSHPPRELSRSTNPTKARSVARGSDKVRPRRAARRRRARRRCSCRSSCRAAAARSTRRRRPTRTRARRRAAVQRARESRREGAGGRPRGGTRSRRRRSARPRPRRARARRWRSRSKHRKRVMIK